jgi:hypothetical protein
VKASDFAVGGMHHRGDGRIFGHPGHCINDVLGGLQRVGKLSIRLLVPKKDRSWRKTVETGIGAWWKKLGARAMTDAEPVNSKGDEHGGSVIAETAAQVLNAFIGKKE